MTRPPFKLFLTALIFFLMTSSMDAADEKAQLKRVEYLYYQGLQYAGKSRYKESEKVWEEGLELARRLKHGAWTSCFLGCLGNIYMRYGDYRRCISYTEDSLEVAKRTPGYEGGVGSAYVTLGSVYMNLGDYQKALEYNDKSIEIHRKLKDRLREGCNYAFYGNIYSSLGDFRRAIEYYDDALDIHRAIDNKTEISSDLRCLSGVYEDIGDYDRMADYSNQALEIARLIGDRAYESFALHNLARVEWYYGEYEKALLYLKESADINSSIGIPTGPEEADIAELYLDMGDISMAEKEYMRLGEERMPIRLGRLNLIKGDHTRANEYFNRALEHARVNRDAVRLFAVSCGLGEGHYGRKEFQDAIRYFSDAIDLTEEQREGLTEDERTRFFTAKLIGFNRSDPYEGMVSVMADMGREEEAFYYSENLKARVLAEAIVRDRSTAGVSPTIVLKEEEFIKGIRALRKEMELLYRNKKMDTYYSRKRELDRMKEEQKAFVDKLRKVHPGYFAVRYPNPVRADRVNLLQGEVLIGFEVTRDKTHVFLMSPGRLSVRTVQVSRQDLKSMVMEYRGFFKDIKTVKDLNSFDPEKGHGLYDLLFGELLKDIPRDSSVIISPDEILGILPFEALVVSVPAVRKTGYTDFGPFPLGVTYMDDLYDISYTQSATSLTFLRSFDEPVRTGTMALAVCDPVFSPADRRFAGRTVSSAASPSDSIKIMGAIGRWKKMGVKGVQERGLGPAVSREPDVFPRLEKTAEVAKVMRSLFGKETMILSGLLAQEEKVESLELGKYRYIVFATHGILDKTIPWIREPALVLTQVNNSSGYDGFLTMSEVMSMDMAAEVVALTACETGVGKNLTGEGVMGMGRAFQYAGCGNVLMSLWEVSEDATVHLSKEFFGMVKKGMSPREAINQARRQVRRDGYGHPFYWASFILVAK